MVDVKTCFVICPVGRENTSARIWSDMVYDCIITPALAKFNIESSRADKITTPGLITPHIIEEIVHSDLVIADMTDLNPTVFYALALRHSVNKPVVHMIKKGQDIPFDNPDFRTIFFDIDVRSAHQARGSLRQSIDAITSGKPFFNPIKVASKLSEMKKSTSGDQKFAAELFEKLSSQISNQEHQIKELTTSMEGMRRSFVVPSYPNPDARAWTPAPRSPSPLVSPTQEDPNNFLKRQSDQPRAVQQSSPFYGSGPVSDVKARSPLKDKEDNFQNVYVPFTTNPKVSKKSIYIKETKREEKKEK